MDGTEFQQAAVKRIKDAFAAFNAGNAIIWHYSCAEFNPHATGATAFHHAAVLVSGQQSHVFSAHAGGEVAALEAFAKFVAHHPPQGIAWKITRSFGFGQLNARLKEIGSSLAFPSDDRVMQLSSTLWEAFGDYADDPRFEKCLEANGVKPAHFLPYAGVLQAIGAAQYETAFRSTEAWCSGMKSIMRRVAHGTFVVAAQSHEVRIALKGKTKRQLIDDYLHLNRNEIRVMRTLWARGDDDACRVGRNKYGPQAIATKIGCSRPNVSKNQKWVMAVGQYLFPATHQPKAINIAAAMVGTGSMRGAA